MDGQFFISLLNPALGLLLACAFLVLWLYQREKAYIAVISCGYVFSALGFTLYEFAIVTDSSAIRIASNSFFLLSASSIAGSAISRYDRRVPYVALAILCLAGIGGLCWFMFVDPSLTNRIYAINFALGGIAILAAVKLAAIPGKQMIDRVIFALSVLAAMNFIVRTVVILHLVGPYNDYDDFPRSIYWSTVQVSHALISIMFALSLIVASALDLLRQLKVDSETDELSGLLNRRGFDQAAGVMIEECAARNRPAVLILADLDHFKAINDTYGHATGDRVIVAFADLLKASVASDVIVGRIGGEEFAALLPDTTLAAARLFAEGVRVSYGATVIPGIHDMPLTASFGVCELSDGDKLTSLLRRADEALYTAKHDGRDRVRVSPAPLDQVTTGSTPAWTQ